MSAFITMSDARQHKGDNILVNVETIVSIRDMGAWREVSTLTGDRFDVKESLHYLIEMIEGLSP